MHLSRLDNEVFFKKAFTDKLVFTQFVKDVIGIDIQVGSDSRLKLKRWREKSIKTYGSALIIYKFF